jgi:hypothetical protein
MWISISLLYSLRRRSLRMLKRFYRQCIRNMVQQSEPPIETRKAIICRQYYYLLPVCIILYIALQLLIGLKSNVCDKNAVPFKEYTKTVYFCAAFSFVISALQQTAKIAGSSMSTGIHVLIIITILRVEITRCIEES